MTLSTARQFRSGLKACAIPFMAALVWGCGDAVVDTVEDAPVADAIIRGVTVVSVDDGTAVISDVVISDGVIQDVRLAQSEPADRAVLDIDGRGKYLIPGLADMHVHLAEPWGPRGRKEMDVFPEDEAQAIADEMFLYLANGVTLVRNMDGWPLHLELRDRIRSGEIDGPEIVTSGPIIYGPGAGALYPDEASAPGAWVASAEEARSVVDAHLDAGFDFIKVYNSMPPEAYAALIDQAHARGAKVAGHIAFDVGVYGALEAGQDSIAHLRGYDIPPASENIDLMSPERFAYWLRISDGTMADFARATKDSGTYNAPTLAVADAFSYFLTDDPAGASPGYKYMSAQMRDYHSQFVLFSRAAIEATLATIPPIHRMLNALHTEGAGLMAGTDTPIYYLVPGFALHTELENYVEAGFSEAEALRIATVNPMTYLGRETQRGRIQAGHEADLVLLNADPLSDIRNTRDIAGVMSDGRWFDRAEIDSRLDGIASRAAVADTDSSQDDPEAEGQEP
ncbi:MAG: amidohydrolase family protein [Pseudomonadota bacterium]